MSKLMELLFGFFALICFLGLYSFSSSHGSPQQERPVEKATFAGGCFWCMEQALDAVEGVASTTVGYTGGNQADPTYEEVSSGKTGHAESIEVLFDPDVISYEGLLDVFWKNIDPTVKDQQFCDKGSQYRSAIFYHDTQQKEAAERSKQKLLDSKKFDAIYTEISEAGPFYEAEKYHQGYYKKNPVRYKFYKYLCGRDSRLNEIWGK